MKILMIAPTPFFSDRGCHVRILEEIKTLQNLNHNITLLTYHLGKNIKNIKTIRTINIPWYKKTEAGASYHKIYLDLLLLTKTIQTIKKTNPDIIHAHLHEGALIAKLAKKITNSKAPIIFDYQGSLTQEMKDHNYLNNKFLFNIFKLLEDSIEKDLKIITSTTKPTYIPLLDAVDTNFFKKTKSNLKKELNLPNKPIVTYLGVLSKYQGTDILLHTAKLVLEEKDVHFLIMGYPNVRYYKNLAKKLNIEKNITFTGRTNYNLAPKLLSLADIAITLKLSETEANGKLYNYMACQLPIIATDNKTNKEIGESTIIYIKPNPKEVKQSIINLLNNKKLANSLSKKARNLAIKKHSWKSRGKQLEELYKKCLEYH